jgi:hypothetical protein
MSTEGSYDSNRVQETEPEMLKAATTATEFRKLNLKC